VSAQMFYFASTLLVMRIGWYVFGERVGPLFWLEVVLILAGIMITQYACQSNKEERSRGMTMPQGCR
jgi:drug/metabolite transporter (DMT)-like permease